jgi:3-dehydro-L-gulonate 2-dehydrogenase
MATTTYDELFIKLTVIFKQEGLSPERASLLGKILAENTRDGVVSHGVQRLPRIIEQIRDKTININGTPEKIGEFSGFEQWDGHHGIGPLNALKMVDRAMNLSDIHGIGICTIRNTNHWLRGATYGYRAAERGYPAICWTNTLANMPAWGTKKWNVGNNPIVFAMPGNPHHVVLDMALSQFSYGKLESYRLRGEELPVPGGFDDEGRFTTNPESIFKSKRTLPIGLWKGSGLAVTLDLFASVLSKGYSTFFMPDNKPFISQIFIAIHPGSTKDEREARQQYLEDSLKKFKELCGSEKASYPGEGTQERKVKSGSEGIFIEDKIWKTLIAFEKQYA